MVAFDASESLTPFRSADGSGPGGAILFDASLLRQAGAKSVLPLWFDPAWWGDRAERVGSGGRGGAWFLDGSPGAGTKHPAIGPAVLRLYLRGGLVAKLTRARYGQIREAELASLIAARGADGPGRLADAATLLDRLVDQPVPEEFLTLGAYEYLE